MSLKGSSAAPLPATTRAAAVADELRRMIITGELEAGARLRQNEVAEFFKVSTTPVREAFARLAREGIVRIDAHRGAIVFAPSVEDIRENYEIRLALEPLATEFAAARIDEAQLAVLDDLQAQMRTALYDDLERYARELNPEFHATIYAAAGRPRLAELIAQLRDAAAAYNVVLALRPQPDGYLESAFAEHERIVAALRAGDGARARDAMREHLQHNADQILTALEPDGT